MGVFSLLMSQEVLRETLILQIETLIGSRGADLARSALQNMAAGNDGLWSTIIGLSISVFAATTVFAQLRSQMNLIWQVKPRPGKGFFVFFRSRILAFVFILTLGFLLLLSLVVDAALNGFQQALDTYLPELSGLIQWGNIVVWFCIAILLFAAMFKYLPDIKIRWMDVIPAAIVTAILYSIGRSLIGMYLGKSAAISAYGAAGSLAIILLWVFYTCQIFLFGAQFSRAYARILGHEVDTKAYAVKKS